MAVSLTQVGHITSILQSSQAKCYSIGDAQRLKSETGDGVTVTWDQHHQKGDIKCVRTFEELWTISPIMSIPRV